MLNGRTGGWDESESEREGQSGREDGRLGAGRTSGDVRYSKGSHEDTEGTKRQGADGAEWGTAF